MPVYTTNLKTARVPHQAKWITFRESRKCEPWTADAVSALAEAIKPPFVWIFTDGSSTGGFGAVIVEPERGVATKLAGLEPKTDTRNVGAELNGLLLGLTNAPVGARVMVVSDYLGIAAWMTSNWRIKDPEVYQKIAQAKTIAAERELDLTFCHHAGHQRDDSDFTRWNCLADRLCDGRAAPGELVLAG